MKNIIAISTGTFILVLAFSCFSNAYAQVSQNENAVEGDPILQEDRKMGTQIEQRVPKTSQKTEELRPRMSFVRMADFYLRNGKLIFGKLVSEGKNRITVEQLDEDRIILSTYSKREIDTRTLHITNTPEYKYYLDLAEYFSGRTWDFKDDPDDFIQAIRCYEKAKQLVAETQRQDSEKIEQINQKIEQLKADRQVWVREVESRAKLKKLEFEAMIETRLKELEDKVNESSLQVDKSMERLDKIIVDTKDNYKRLEKSISLISKNLSRQLEILEDRIEDNRDLIYRWRWHPRYYYYPYKSNNKSDSNQ